MAYQFLIVFLTASAPLAITSSLEWDLKCSYAYILAGASSV